MDKINRLSHLFSEFPNRPKTVKAIRVFSAYQKPEFLDEMVNLISNLKKK